MYGLLIYDAVDINKNQWFINHFIEVSSLYNTTLKLITSDELYKILNINIKPDIKYSIDSDTYTDIDTSINLISTFAWDNLPYIPDFIINRSRDSFLSFIFELKNIKSFNSSKVIQIANDKNCTHKYFYKNGINYLPYIYLSSNPLDSTCFSDIISFAEKNGYPLVFKPVNGHGGADIHIIQNEKELIFILNTFFTNSKNKNSYILQKCASTIGKDLRVYVLGEKIIAGILRSSDSDFRANFSLGGKTSYHELSKDEFNLTKKIISSIDSDFIGIDLIYNNGKPILNEIEDAVGCRMLYANTDIDIVEEYFKYILSKVKP